MAVKFYERFNSRDLEVTTRDGTALLKWCAITTAGEPSTDVYAQAVSFCPVAFGGLIRDRIRVTPQGGPVFDVEVSYGVLTADGPAGNTPGTSNPPAGGESPTDSEGFTPGFSCEITAQTVHITQSIETRFRRTPNDGAAPGVGTGPNYEKAIQVTKDGVAGCDITAGAAQFTLQAVRGTFTRGYLKKLRSIVGKTNDRVWSGFPRGEVTYRGATVQDAADGGLGRFNLAHKFELAENEVNIDVGNGITVPDKRGWEYLWCAYEEKVVGNFVLWVPAAAFVETVVKEADFREIEIGG